jgi:hypothetical protein
VWPDLIIGILFNALRDFRLTAFIPLSVGIYTIYAEQAVPSFWVTR